jgi:hypothetical protein
MDDVEVQDGQQDGEAGGYEGDGGQDDGQREGEGGEGRQLSAEEQQRKSSREYSNWLKGLKDTDPNNKRFARQAQDDHSRLFALHQLEPNGVDGVREKYALLDSVTFDGPDGEPLTGAEAVSALQDAARDTAHADEMIANGDPAVLDLFGDNFNDGLTKLAPHILERVASANPEAYGALLLPHFVEQLKSSDLVRNHNALVDLMAEQPPQYLTPEQKQGWMTDQMRKLSALVTANSQWFNAQAQKAQQRPEARGRGDNGRQQGGQQKPDRLQMAEQREQDFHWRTNIAPGLDKHADKRFTELFKPYAQRLRLPPDSLKSLKSDFAKAVVGKAAAKLSNGQQNAYMRQIARYRSQRNPDPSTVLNFASVEFDKHARGVMQALINSRYKSFLARKAGTQSGNGNQNGNRAGGQNRGPVGPNVQIVGAKPRNIDFKNTPLEWIHQRKYKTTDGKVVQVR